MLLLAITSAETPVNALHGQGGGIGQSGEKGMNGKRGERGVNSIAAVGRAHK